MDWLRHTGHRSPDATSAASASSAASSGSVRALRSSASSAGASTSCSAGVAASGSASCAVIAPGQATNVPVAGRFALQNAPNPFNPVTKISYTIKSPGHLTLKIFNVRGELVKTLINGHVQADGYIEWDGTNGQGGKVSSGVYFYQAQMGGDVQVSKMALVK